MGDKLYGLCITHNVTVHYLRQFKATVFHIFFFLFHKKLNITKHIYSVLAMYCICIYEILIEHNMYGYDSSLEVHCNFTDDQAVTIIASV